MIKNKNAKLSIKEMKNLISAYQDITPKLYTQLKVAYQKGYVDGRRYSGTMLVDISTEELELLAP